MKNTERLQGYPRLREAERQLNAIQDPKLDSVLVVKCYKDITRSDDKFNVEVKLYVKYCINVKVPEVSNYIISMGKDILILRE